MVQSRLVVLLGISTLLGAVGSPPDVKEVKLLEEERRELLSLVHKTERHVVAEGGVVEQSIVKVYDFDLFGERARGKALYFLNLLNDSDETLTEFPLQSDSEATFGFSDMNLTPLGHTLEKKREDAYVYHVALEEPVPPGQKLKILAKAVMGDELWYKKAHHRTLVKQGEPTGFQSKVAARKGFAQTFLWQLPKGCRVLGLAPAPVEIWAEDDRLNVLFIFWSSKEAGELYDLKLEYLLPLVEGTADRADSGLPDQANGR